MKMKLLAISLLVVGSLLAQNPNTAKWPSSNATDSDLFVANNNAQTTLNGSINSSVTSLVLTSGTSFTAPIIITIDTEVIPCTTLTSNTLSGCTRGTQGTTAASHTSGASVFGYVTAYHYNQIAAEIKAIESSALRTTTGVQLATFLQGDNTTIYSATGTSAYSGSPVVGCGIATLKAGQEWSVNPDVGSNGAASLTACTFGLINIKKDDGTTDPGTAIQAHHQFRVFYDGSVYRLMSPSGVVNPSLGLNGALSETWTAGTGGVTAFTLVSKDTSAPSKIVSATSGGYGIALGTASATGLVEVARIGAAPCVTDTGGATAGNLAIGGSGTAVDCKDSGQTSSSAIPIGTRIVGFFRSSATAGNTAIVELTPDHFGTLLPVTLSTSTGTFTLANGKTLTVNNTMTETATDGSTIAFGGGGTVLYNGGALGTPSSGNVAATTGYLWANLASPPGVINPQSATYQVLASDFTQCKEITVPSGTFTITLVASGSQPANGQCIDIVNYGTGVITVARSGQNINGAAANLTLAAGSASAPTAMHITSDSSNYFAELFGTSSGGVTSITGDGALFTNTSSTGGVTLSLGSVGSHKVWMNNTGSIAAPGYESLGTADLPTALANQTSINGLGITGSTGTLTVLNGTTLTNPIHQYGASFGTPSGVALTTGMVQYFDMPQACTIIGYIVEADAGTATVKFWKIADGTALPTVTNVINTSGVALASGTRNKSFTVTDFTSTAVAAYDSGAVTITAVSGAGYVNAKILCQ